MLFDSLALISLFIVIMLLGRLVNICPSLLACLIRGKENINLEMSVKLSRDRNFLSLAMVLPFCLTICHSGVYRPDFMNGMNEDASLGIIIGVFGLYMGLRILLRRLVRPRKSAAFAYRAAASAAHTFFIILTLILLAAGGILSFFDVNHETIKNAIIWVSGAIYLLFLLRKIQIFATAYNFVAVFLYLCALEIIPTGVLVASAMIL